MSRHDSCNGRDSIHVERAGDGPPLLLLHGFTGQRGDLGAARRRSGEPVPHHRRRSARPRRSRTRRPTRRATAWSARSRTWPRCSTASACERAIVLGYSMGGRVALHFAAAAAGARGGAGARERVAGPRRRRPSARRASPPTRHWRDLIERDGVPAFVDRWEALPLCASQARLPDATARRLRAAAAAATRPWAWPTACAAWAPARQAPLHDRLARHRDARRC